MCCAAAAACSAVIGALCGGCTAAAGLGPAAASISILVLRRSPDIATASVITFARHTVLAEHLIRTAILVETDRTLLWPGPARVVHHA
jgi:hypothetical protein